MSPIGSNAATEYGRTSIDGFTIASMPRSPNVVIESGNAAQLSGQRLELCAHRLHRGVPRTGPPSPPLDARLFNPSPVPLAYLNAAIGTQTSSRVDQDTAELRRCNSDDRCRHAVDVQRPADDICHLSKALAPHDS